jgi:hypothetical protein
VRDVRQKLSATVKDAEENRVLKARLGRRRLRLDDEQRRRLAVLGERIGRSLLREFATLEPDAVNDHRGIGQPRRTPPGTRRSHPGGGRRQERLLLDVSQFQGRPTAPACGA